MRALLRELRDAVPELLGARRAGVVAALLAAAERCGNAAVQTDAARALSSALAARASAGRPGATQARLNPQNQIHNTVTRNSVGCYEEFNLRFNLRLTAPLPSMQASMCYAQCCGLQAAACTPRGEKGASC